MLPHTQAKPPAAIKLDYGIRSAFLDNLSEDSKFRIFDLTTRASHELHRWATRHPLIRRVRVWPLTLTVAAATPFASVPSLVTMARMNLWGFTIDDLFDEEMVPWAELHRRTTRYHDILAGAGLQAADRSDTLAVALQDIRSELEPYPLFAHLHGRWSDAVGGMLNAMMQEYHWRVLYNRGAAQGGVPDYEAYLEYSLGSIGVAGHFWTLLITLNDASALGHLPRLQQMERTASRCIRLANDLRSYEKEVAEGKINGVVIRQREAMARGSDHHTALQQAYAHVTAEMQHGLESLAVLQHQDRTATGQPEQAIADLARVVCDFYAQHDYHTLVPGKGRAS